MYIEISIGHCNHSYYTGHEEIRSCYDCCITTRKWANQTMKNAARQKKLTLKPVEEESLLQLGNPNCSNEYTNAHVSIDIKKKSEPVN